MPSRIPHRCGIQNLKANLKFAGATPLSFYLQIAREPT
ncbi:hypothetical protein CAMGR0001_0373 [Campylobacter gracilis RM3268]|uniref:Uncharacterized protein n=1 Tax=Campylobacter gracilis RM3268 TaxID=553220 RepID=C8PHD0_9BACT|nr:hypothetical protein CAMGR0001_0373 [Campylobacter gracilis RM3268]